MRSIIKMFLISSIVFCVTSVWADDVASNPVALNQATVVVANRSAPALQTALQSAFSEVMIKMSGSPTVMSVPAVQNAAKNATNWVESYSYIPSTVASGSSGLTLQVVFDQSGLEKLLKTSQNTAKQSTTPANPKKQTAQIKQNNLTNNFLNTPSIVMMEVSGIHSIADYVQVMRALRDKSDVMHVSVKDMQSDHVLLKIKVVGNSADFQKVLALDNNFKSAADGMKTKQLQYYWMGNQA